MSEGLSSYSFHFITYSLGCGASCDSSDVLAQKHRCTSQYNILVAHWTNTSKEQETQAGSSTDRAGQGRADEGSNQANRPKKLAIQAHEMTHLSV